MCLGIRFPRQLKDLVKVNSDPLLQKNYCDAERWATLNLSMAGTVEVLKMNCVPKLNLFSPFSWKFPIVILKDLISKIFIWNGKCPRLNHNKLQRPTERGGLGLQKMLFYYHAFHLI